MCIALLMDLFCLVCCVSDSVCELFHNIFGCGRYFAVECYGSVEGGWWCSVGYTVYSLLKHVCVVPVITVCI